MRRKKQLKPILALVLAVVMVLALAACGGGGGGGGDALKGTWEGSSQDFEVTWTFDGKGGCKMENEYGIKDDGTYTIDGDTVMIKLSRWDDELEYKMTQDEKDLLLDPVEDYRPRYELTKK